MAYAFDAMSKKVSVVAQRSLEQLPDLGDNLTKIKDQLSTSIDNAARALSGLPSNIPLWSSLNGDLNDAKREATQLLTLIQALVKKSKEAESAVALSDDEEVVVASAPLQEDARRRLNRRMLE